MQAGHVMVPNLLLDRQRGLGLDPTDLNILLHLMRHWYHADSFPFPGKRKIAWCMEVSVSTVRRRIADLEKRGVLKRVKRRSKEHGGQTTNQYDLSGLVELLKPFAKEAVETKKKRAQEDSDTHQRKRPLSETRT
jgi:DNA replication protein DnaD